MENCKHEEFIFHSKVGRLTETEGGEITSWVLECKIQCSQCKMFFEFIGVPNGSSPSKPMASADFTELRMPIRPNTGAIATNISHTVREEKTDVKDVN